MQPDSPLNVVSWNIQFGIEVQAAIAELHFIDEIPVPDILLLQEMDEEGTAAIATALDANYAYTSSAPHKQSSRDFGNAVISPWPMSDVAEVPLPHKSPVSGHPRAATRATLSIEGTDVLAYSVHTEVPSLRLSKRVEQFRRVVDDIGDHRRDLVVVAGDFNTVTSRGVNALRRTMAAAGLEHVSVGAGPSLRRAGRAIPLDHVFASGLRPIAGGVAWEATASDHMPMWIQLVADDSPRT